MVKIQKDTTLTASEKAKNGTKKLEEALKKKRKIAKVKLATAGVVVG